MLNVFVYYPKCAFNVRPARGFEYKMLGDVHARKYSNIGAHTQKICVLLNTNIFVKKDPKTLLLIQNGSEI